MRPATHAKVGDGAYFWPFRVNKGLEFADFSTRAIGESTGRFLFQVIKVECTHQTALKLILVNIWASKLRVWYWVTRDSATFGPYPGSRKDIFTLLSLCPSSAASLVLGVRGYWNIMFQKRFCRALRYEMTFFDLSYSGVLPARWVAAYCFRSRNLDVNQ